MSDIDAESILGALGLQRQRGSADVVIPAIGAFVVGGLIGAGIGLLLAPKAGKELRREIGQRFDEAVESKEALVSEYKLGQSEPKKSGQGASGATTPARPTSF